MSRHSAERILEALYAAGVDNWEGYDLAMQSLNDQGPYAEEGEDDD